MVLTEEDRRAGFSLVVVDLMVYLRHGDEVIAAFPIGTTPEPIRGMVQAEKMKNPTEFLYGSVSSEIDAVEAVRRFRESGGR